MLKLEKRVMPRAEMTIYSRNCGNSNKGQVIVTPERSRVINQFYYEKLYVNFLNWRVFNMRNTRLNLSTYLAKLRVLISHSVL